MLMFANRNIVLLEISKSICISDNNSRKKTRNHSDLTDYVFAHTVMITFAIPHYPPLLRGVRIANVLTFSLAVLHERPVHYGRVSTIFHAIRPAHTTLVRPRRGLRNLPLGTRPSTSVPVRIRGVHVRTYGRCYVARNVRLSCVQ